MQRLVTAFALVLLTSCAHRSAVVAPAALDEQATTQVAESTLRALTIELAFEGDSLDAETAAALQRLAALLRDRPAVKVQLAGEAPGTRLAVRSPRRSRSLAYGDGFAGTRKQRAAPPLTDEGEALIKLTVRAPAPAASPGLEQAVSRAP